MASLGLGFRGLCRGKREPLVHEWGCRRSIRAGLFPAKANINHHHQNVDFLRIQHSLVFFIFHFKMHISLIIMTWLWFPDLDFMAKNALPLPWTKNVPSRTIQNKWYCLQRAELWCSSFSNSRGRVSVHPLWHHSMEIHCPPICTGTGRECVHQTGQATIATKRQSYIIKR